MVILIEPLAFYTSVIVGRSAPYAELHRSFYKSLYLSQSSVVEIELILKALTLYSSELAVAGYFSGLAVCGEIASVCYFVLCICNVHSVLIHINVEVCSVEAIALAKLYSHRSFGMRSSTDLQLTGLYYLTVYLVLVSHLCFGKISEIISIKNCKHSVIPLSIHRLIYLFSLQRSGLEASVGKYKSIGTEVSVVSFLSEISAVSHLTFRDGRHVVCPLPNTSTYKLRLLVEYIPVILKISGTVTHSVTVLTPENRTLIPCVADISVKLLGHRIHSADYVNTIGIGVVTSLLSRVFAIRVLVMHQTLISHIGIIRLDVFTHLYVIDTEIRLVSKAPHNYTGVVLISLEKSCRSVYMSSLPFGILAGPHNILIVTGPTSKT